MPSHLSLVPPPLSPRTVRALHEIHDAVEKVLRRPDLDLLTTWDLMDVLSILEQAVLADNDRRLP